MTILYIISSILTFIVGFLIGPIGHWQLHTAVPSHSLLLLDEPQEAPAATVCACPPRMRISESLFRIENSSVTTDFNWLNFFILFNFISCLLYKLFGFRLFPNVIILSWGQSQDILYLVRSPSHGISEVDIQFPQIPWIVPLDCFCYHLHRQCLFHY